MTITRVNEFLAKDGKAAALGEYLASIVPAIEASEGCLYCHLLQGHDNPRRFLIIETWESIASHQLAIQDIDRDEFLATMRELAHAPQAEYFTS